MEGGEGDEVGFVVGGYGEEGVADLFDLDGAGEGGFLGVVALELREGTLLMRWGFVGSERAYLDAVLVIPDAVGRHWRMVTISCQLCDSCTTTVVCTPDLLRNQLCRPRRIFKLTKEQLAQERIQRFLLRPKLVTPTAV